MQSSIEKYYKIIDSTELSDATKSNYKDRLRKLTEITGEDVSWILTHSAKTWEKVTKCTTSPGTMKVYITSILAVFKYEPTLKAIYKQSHAKWFELFQKVSGIVEERLNKLEPSERQVETYVEWKDIIKGRDAFATKSSKSQGYIHEVDAHSCFT